MINLYILQDGIIDQLKRQIAKDYGVDDKNVRVAFNFKGKLTASISVPDSYLDKIDCSVIVHEPDLEEHDKNLKDFYEDY